MKHKLSSKHNRHTQLEFIPQKLSQRFNQRFFGGAMLKGRRKGLRPLSRSEALHFVLRSQFGRGVHSFRNRRNYSEINRILSSSAQKYGVKIYHRAIQSNHIHLIFRITNRRLYRCFISVITGKIAQLVMQGLSFKEFLQTLSSSSGWGEGYQKPHQGQAFWDYRPFQRILNWGRDYQIACQYLLKNTLEALGFVAYQERPKKNAYTKYQVKISPPRS